MSRLLTTLLLYRNGFYVGKYISLEAKIAKNKDNCEKQAIDNEFAIELDKEELKLFKGLFAELFK